MVFIWAYKITLYEGSSLLSPCSSTLLSINAVEIDPEVDTDNLDTPSRSHLLLHRSGPFVVLLAGHGNGWEMRWQVCAVVQCVLALLGSHDWKVSPMQQVQDKVHELVTQLETLHSNYCKAMKRFTITPSSSAGWGPCQVTAMFWQSCKVGLCKEHLAASPVHGALHRHAPISCHVDLLEGSWSCFNHHTWG